MKQIAITFFLLSLVACAASDNQEVAERSSEKGQLQLPKNQKIDWSLPTLDCSNCVVDKKVSYYPQGPEETLLMTHNQKLKAFVLESKRSKKRIKGFHFEIMGPNQLEACIDQNCIEVLPDHIFRLRECQLVISDTHYEIRDSNMIQDGNRIEFTVFGSCSD